MFIFRRNSVLTEHDVFFRGWKEVMVANQEHVVNAFKMLKHRDNTIETVLVYGELFGGYFQHKNEKLRPQSGTRHIQIEVEYSPNLHFYAFDVAVNGHRLQFVESLEILEKSGFLYSEPLMIGTLEQCLAFDVESFSTTIPSKLRLPPPINPNDGSLVCNIAEGVVLRTLYGPNHCVKLKSKAFWEVVRCGKRGDLNRLIKQGVSNGLKEDTMEYVGRCVNDNRYNAVVSKVGEPNQKNIQQIISMMIGDVEGEIKRYRAHEVGAMDTTQQRFLKHFIKGAVKDFVRPKMKRF